MRRVSGASPKPTNPLSEKRFQAVEGKLLWTRRERSENYAEPAICTILAPRPGRSRGDRGLPPTAIRERRASALE